MRRGELRTDTAFYLQCEHILRRRKVQRLIFTGTDGENSFAIDENLVGTGAPKSSCIPQK